MAQIWYHNLGSTRSFLRFVRFLGERLAPGLHAEQRCFGAKTARRCILHLSLSLYHTANSFRPRQEPSESSQVLVPKESLYLG